MRFDLADVDPLALPRWELALLTIAKLFEDAPLPGIRYDVVPPPPLSAEPGVSMIGAGAPGAKEKFVSLLLDWGFWDIVPTSLQLLPFTTVQRLVVGQVVQDALENIRADDLSAHRSGEINQSCRCLCPTPHRRSLQGYSYSWDHRTPWLERAADNL